MSSCRLPVCNRSRERSSSQTDTPAADRAARFSFCVMIVALLLRLVVYGSLCGGRDGLGGETELAEQRLVVGRFAVVLDRDDLAGVTDQLVPALRDGRFDRHSRRNRWRQHRI